MAYLYDVFLSYPRGGNVGPWVHNHFLPLLQNCLDAELPQNARIFVDQQIPTGAQWPEELKQALLASRMMVSVWTPPYFRSEWCMAEWESMLQREIVLGNERPARGLVYPVIYSDGTHFDKRAKTTQYKKSLSDYTYPYPSFKDSTEYLKFHDAMVEIAREIEGHLDQIPVWQAGWPIVEPALAPAKPVSLPRI